MFDIRSAFIVIAENVTIILYIQIKFEKVEFCAFLMQRYQKIPHMQSLLKRTLCFVLYLCLAHIKFMFCLTLLTIFNDF